MMDEKLKSILDRRQAEAKLAKEQRRKNMPNARVLVEEVVHDLKPYFPDLKVLRATDLVTGHDWKHDAYDELSISYDRVQVWS